MFEVSSSKNEGKERFLVIFERKITLKMYGPYFDTLYRKFFTKITILEN